MHARWSALRGLAAAAFLFGAAAARADWLIRADGQREKCIVVRANDQYIRIQRGEAILDIPANNATYERQTAAENAVLLAEYGLGSQPLSQTVAQYRDALAQGAPGRLVCDSVAVMLRWLEERETEAPEESKAALDGFLAELAGPASDGATEDFLYRAAMRLVQDGAVQPAMALFAKIPAEQLQLDPSIRASIADEVVKQIDGLLDKRDFTAAADRMEALYLLDPERAKSCQASMHLASAGAMRAAGDYAGALEIYARDLYPEFPAIACDRGEAALREAAGHAHKTGDFAAAEALALGPGKALLGEAGVSGLLAELYKDWGMTRLGEARFEEARVAFRRYYALRPDEEMTLLKTVEYRERKAQVPEGFFEEHYLLGKWCLENGIPDCAAAEFQIAREDPDFREVCDFELRDLESGRYERMLREAIDLKNQNLFVEARAQVDFVLRHAGEGKLHTQALEVLDLVEKSKALAQARVKQEAEVLFQNAERSMNSAEQLAIAAEIIRKFPDTAAARKADELRRGILRTHMSRLERVSESAEPRRIASSESSAAKSAARSEMVDREIRRILSAMQTGGGK